MLPKSCGLSGATTADPPIIVKAMPRSEEHTSELQSHSDLVCRLLLEKKKNNPLVRLESKLVCHHPRTCENKQKRVKGRSAARQAVLKNNPSQGSDECGSRNACANRC